MNLNRPSRSERYSWGSGEEYMYTHPVSYEIWNFYEKYWKDRCVKELGDDADCGKMVEGLIEVCATKFPTTGIAAVEWISMWLNGTKVVPFIPWTAYLLFFLAFDWHVIWSTLLGIPWGAWHMLRINEATNFRFFPYQGMLGYKFNHVPIIPEEVLVCTFVAVTAGRQWTVHNGERSLLITGLHSKMAHWFANKYGFLPQKLLAHVDNVHQERVMLYHQRRCVVMNMESLLQCRKQSGQTLESCMQQINPDLCYKVTAAERLHTVMNQFASGQVPGCPYVPSVGVSRWKLGLILFFSYLVVTVVTFLRTLIRQMFTDWQLFVSKVVAFLGGIVKGATSYYYYFMLLFTTFLQIFVIIILFNLLSLIPYTFAYTSHIIFTFSLSSLLLNLANSLGIERHGLLFLKGFMPGGTPVVLIIFVVAIEIVSVNTRVFSLAIRLFANLMSGHILLTILAGFGEPMSWFELVIFVSILICVYALESVIGGLQGYVFSTLGSTYFGGAIDLH